MSNMDTRPAEVNYVTLHEEAVLKRDAAVFETFIKEALAKLNIPTRSEVDALSKKIDDLSAKIARS